MLRTSTRTRSLATLLSLGLSSLTLAACGDNGTGGNEEEVITTVLLTFTPSGGGAAVTAAFRDADGDGGNAPTIDSIGLAAGTSYSLAVRFQNELETPAEEITDEVRDEGDEHQVFFTGTAVSGPASNQAAAPLTHTYADMDAAGLPIGLANTIVAAGGNGDLVLTLRHMPPVNEVAVKTAQAAETVRSAGGFSTLGGATDVQVTFPVAIPVP